MQAQPQPTAIEREAAIFEVLINAGSAIGAPDAHTLLAMGLARDMLRTGHSAHRSIEYGKAKLVDLAMERRDG